MCSLQDRLISMEDDFVSALIEGDAAVVAFNQRWERLVDDIDVALQDNNLDDGILALVHVTATRIATLADITADVYTSYNAFTTELVDQIEELMSELTLVDHPHASLDDRSLHVPLETRPVAAPKRRRSPESRASSNPAKRQRVGSLSQNDLNISGQPLHKNMFGVSSLLPSSRHTTPKSTSLGSSPSPDVDRNPLTRKRRLSETDLFGPPDSRKRPHIGPRLHAVSDSFAVPHLPEEPLALGDPVTVADLSALEPLGANDVCNLFENVDAMSSLSELASLDTLLKSILDPNIPSIVLPTSRCNTVCEDNSSGTISTPSPAAAQTYSPAPSSSRGSSTSSSPHLSPATPPMNAGPLDFNLGTLDYAISPPLSADEHFQFVPLLDRFMPYYEAEAPPMSLAAYSQESQGLLSRKLDDTTVSFDFKGKMNVNEPLVESGAEGTNRTPEVRLLCA
ncbi:hypothetical protein C8Q79DRAFT_935831 [Trametes meyenii]|nr:hypothetical protein C8Q79DRAFT_935831 [Trametes meyenii]